MKKINVSGNEFALLNEVQGLQNEVSFIYLVKLTHRSSFGEYFIIEKLLKEAENRDLENLIWEYGTFVK